MKEYFDASGKYRSVKQQEKTQDYYEALRRLRRYERREKLWMAAEAIVWIAGTSLVTYLILVVIPEAYFKP